MQVPERLKIKDSRAIYFYSVITGIVAGFGAVAFSYLLAYAEHFSLDLLMGLPRSHPPGEIHFEKPGILLNRWYIFFLPILGGMLAGFVSHLFCKDAVGTGTDGMIHAFHHNEGNIGGRVPFFRAIATIFTLASGGSAGKEGPISQIGAGFGSALAQLLGAGARARRTLLLVGMAGGLGAIFRAPLGGALTAVETVYTEDFESDSLVPAIIASVTSYLVFTMIMGEGAIFAINKVSLNDYRQIFLYIVLGLVCTGLGWIFIRMFRKMQDFFAGLSLHPVLKPTLGGVFVGVIGVLVPEILGGGLGLVQETILGNGMFGTTDYLNLAGFFLLIAVLKMLVTSFTIASGGSGGVFGPSLFIGGMIGGSFGSLSAFLFPTLHISIAAFTLVGMGAFYGGIASAPIAGMIMVCDMIGSYALLPPLMIVSIISVTLSSKWSIYRGQLANRFKSPAHYWDMNFDVLEKMPISRNFSNFRKNAIVQKNLLLTQLDKISTEVQASDFVVINADETYAGIVSLRKTRMSEEYEHIRHLVTIEDAIDSSIAAVSPNDSLGDALRIISETEIDKVAVVSKEKKVIGYLRYIDIMSAYRSGLRKME